MAMSAAMNTAMNMGIHMAIGIAMNMHHRRHCHHHHHHHNDDKMHFSDCHEKSAAEHICNCLFRTSTALQKANKLLCKETGNEHGD